MMCCRTGATFDEPVEDDGLAVTTVLLDPAVEDDELEMSGANWLVTGQQATTQAKRARRGRRQRADGPRKRRMADGRPQLEWRNGVEAAMKG